MPTEKEIEAAMIALLSKINALRKMLGQVVALMRKGYFRDTPSKKPRQP